MFLIAAGFLLNGCTNQNLAEKNEAILEQYGELAPHITERNFNEIVKFTNHENTNLSSLAWRALAKTTPDNPDDFLEMVIGEDQSEGWFALSFQPLENAHLNRITEDLRSGEIQSDGVCEVFFRHGTADHFEVLVNHTPVTSSEICARAVGGIVTRQRIPAEQIRNVFELAFQQEDYTIRRNLLYGFFRGRLNQPQPDSELHSEMLNIWSGTAGEDEQVDQYMIRTLGASAVNDILEVYIDRELRDHIQLSVELAQNLDSNSHDHQTFNRFLYHPNPHVVIAVLETIRDYDEVNEDWLAEIEAEFAVRERNHEIFITSLEVLQTHNVSMDGYRTKLEFSEQSNPYLLNRILEIYKNLESENQFAARLFSYLKEEGIEAYHAANAITQLWRETGDEEIQQRIRDEVHRQIPAGNRSVLDGLSPLLAEDTVIDDNDYSMLMEQFENYRLAGDEEIASILSTAIRNRYPERNGPDFEPEASFRIPDWQQLYDLGIRPLWKLETTKGTIQIRLDPLSAPFTVSSIDSLTRAGVYDDVAFHRVVKNFVIQGGDFDRRDGFGGPDYTLPTEPSFHSFERGAVGIASSGTDTEGSQYFIMHQWAPHLDGNYTLFGQVIRGMGVVDRIQVGDRVLKAEIY